MAFGQSSGYPASHRQLEQLSELVVAAGHVDFRDARGPLGLTQRQANGKFTSDEADELIARLEAEAELAAALDDGDAPAPAPAPTPPRLDAKEQKQAATLRKVSDHVLAAELQRRGWVVLEP